MVEYDQPRTTRIHVLLEDYEDSYSRTERRLAAYELNQAGDRIQRIGYLPKDAPRREGTYLATLHRPEGAKGKQKRIVGTLTPLKDQDG